MAGPASTVAFVIARSPARASKAPAAPDGPPGADASWGRRHPGATATLQAPCLAGDLDAGVLRAAGIPRRSHPPAARPPPGSHGNRSRIGRSSATCAAAVVQELRRGDDEHDRQSISSSHGRGPDGGSHAHGPTITTVSGQSLRDSPTAPRSCRAAAACSRSGRRRRGPAQAATDPVDRRGPRTTRASRTALAVAASLAAVCRPRADGRIKCGSIHNYELTPLAGTAQSSSVRRGTATSLARLCRQARPTGRERNTNT